MMKKISFFLISFLILTFLLGSASKASEESSYSEYEIVKLYNEVSKKTPVVVMVPAGLYTIGKDLPAGVYTILKNSEVAQNTDNDFSHVAVFKSIKEYNEDPDNLFNEDSHALIASNTYWNGFSYELTNGMILCVKMGKAGIVKHSKNLFAAFWKTVDGQVPSVDLSSIIRSGRSEELFARNEVNEDSHIIVDASVDWIVTKKYEYNDKYGYYCFVVFKHTFPVDQKTFVKFTFYDNKNHIIGETVDDIGCTGSDFEYIASGKNENEFKYAVVSFSSSDLKRTTNCMDGIKVTSSREGLKIIVTAENIGEKPISSCKLDVLYFDKDKNIIDSSNSYLYISYSDEMKKGEIITQEINKYFGDFDSYKLFYNACNFGL